MSERKVYLQESGTTPEYRDRAIEDLSVRNQRLLEENAALKKHIARILAPPGSGELEELKAKVNRRLEKAEMDYWPDDGRVFKDQRGVLKDAIAWGRGFLKWAHDEMAKYKRVANWKAELKEANPIVWAILDDVEKHSMDAAEAIAFCRERNLYHQHAYKKGKKAGRTEARPYVVWEPDYERLQGTEQLSRYSNVYIQKWVKVLWGHYLMGKRTKHSVNAYAVGYYLDNPLRRIFFFNGNVLGYLKALRAK